MGKTKKITNPDVDIYYATCFTFFVCTNLLIKNKNPFALFKLIVYFRFKIPIYNEKRNSYNSGPRHPYFGRM